MIEKAGAGVYRMAIRNAIRGLWTGAVDREQFGDIMSLAIEQGLAAAFAEGAKDCGIKPGDYTEAEQDAIQEAIVNELTHVSDLADAVQAGSKANGGKIDPLFQRGEMWIIRYKDLVNRGKVMACGDRKYVWTLGDAEHCTTCARLAGQVRRGSFWRDHVLPQNAPNDKLECGGWRCQCSLQGTDDPVTRGRFPRVP